MKKLGSCFRGSSQSSGCGCEIRRAARLRLGAHADLRVAPVVLSGVWGLPSRCALQAWEMRPGDGFSFLGVSRELPGVLPGCCCEWEPSRMLGAGLCPLRGKKRVGGGKKPVPMGDWSREWREASQTLDACWIDSSWPNSKRSQVRGLQQAAGRGWGGTKQWGGSRTGVRSPYVAGSVSGALRAVKYAPDPFWWCLSETTSTWDIKVSKTNTCI